MNQYKVDRAREGYFAPVGMNSILYVGDSMPEAMRVFNYANGGKNAWNGEDSSYGVMLSIWSPERRAYVVKRWKSK